MVGCMFSLLYVDDEPDLLDIAKSFLEENGDFSIDAAHSGMEGLLLLGKKSYDAVISDYQMPGMDGIAFLKEIRARYGDIPFILFTGRGREEVVIEAFNAGADSYIQKGGDPESLFTELAHKTRQLIRRKRAEESLRDSEERFRGMAERSRDVIITSDKNFRITYVSPSIKAITGIEPGELIGKTPDTLFLDRAEVEKIFTATERDRVAKTSIEIVMRMKKKDGSWAFLEARGTPIFRDGNFSGVQVQGRDITDRQHAETVLRESEEKFRTLVEHSLDGILILDPAGTLLFANQAAGQIIEAENYRDMVGAKNVLEFIAPESQPDVIRDFSQVAQGIDGYLARYKIITTKGSERWVESLGKTIRFDGAAAILISLRDISERKWAEDILRESENKFATVFRSSPVALTLVSATDGTFVDVNDAFVRNTGYSREEVIGSTSEMLGIFADRNERERMVSSLRSQRCVYGMELKCRIKTGEIRTCLFSSGLILMGGKPHILSTIEDITERKAAESALQTMVRSMVGTTGIDSLRKITENVSSWLGAECVMIGEIQHDKKTVKVLSMLRDGKEIPDFSYTLKGTPCDNVAEKGFCLYPDNVIQLFPESKDLVDLNIRGYVGTSLRNSEAQVIGILCVLSRNPIQPTQGVREIMDVIAVKAAAEIERSQMEEALRESEEKFRMLVDHSLDGILILDMTGTILFGNHAAGRVVDAEDRSDLIGTKNVLEFLDPESRESALRDFGKVAQGIDAYLVNYQVITATGRRIWVECIGKRIIFRNSPALLVSMRDISARKSMEDEVLRINQQLNLLSTITRHDVLNKISVIQGYLAISKKRGPEQDYPAILEKIESATKAIKSQIEFTRIYQAIGTKEPGWQKPADLASSIHIPNPVILRNQLGNLEIYADLMLEKVFQNLMDNSVRHGGNVTEIRLRTRIDPDGLTVIFEDNGTGIPTENKEAIFERGFGNNTGLGLFLAREILGITGITIKENGETGKGAHFEILVPKGAYRIQVSQAEFPKC